MERLTEKVFAFNGTSCMQIKDCDNDTCDQTCRSRTGSEGCEGCPIQIAIDKLAEYEDLEEQGKLLKLPCAVGDTVYIIDDIENEFERTSIVTGIEIEEENEVYIMVSDGFQSGSSSSFGVDDFGKTIFLTRPDAERALAEMEGKK